MVPSAQRFLDENGFGSVVCEEPLQGGLISRVVRLAFADGRTLVYKESDHAKPAMYECEADGLEALRKEGRPRVPEVLSFDEDHILMEDFGPRPEWSESYWIEFGRRLARLHNHTAERFGYHRANYQGTILMDNEWSDDGPAHFGRTRVLVFLHQARVEAILTAEDRRNVERLVAKMPDLIPPQKPSLCHGDLWLGNVLVAPGGEPVLIDPAVYYGMPEADIALLPMHREVPPEFWDAYEEIHPLEPGWRERLDLLALRDAIGMVAEFGADYGSYERVLSTLKRYL